MTNVHPFHWSAELRSLHTCREPDVVPLLFTRRDHHHVHHQHALTSVVLKGSLLFVAAQAGRFCLCQSTFDRGHSFTVLPRPATFCVESQRVHAYINSSSVRVESVDRSLLHYFHPEHVANAFTHDNKHILQCVLHDSIRNVSIYTGSGAETHGK